MKEYLTNQLKSKLIATLIIFALNSQIFSQANDYDINTYNGLKWEQFIKKAESDLNVKFYFNNSDIPDFTVKTTPKTKTLIQLLVYNLEAYKIHVSIDKRGNIFLSKGQKLITGLPSNFFKQQQSTQKSIQDTIDRNKEEKSKFIKTSRDYIAKTIIVGTKKKGVHKSRLKLDGTVRNSKTGEAVNNVTIIDKETKKGVVTNIKGEFSLVLNKGNHILEISSVNINKKQLKLDLLSDGKIEIWVEDKVIMLEGLEVRAQKNNLKEINMGIENLSSKAVKNIPLVFGEKDIIKVALLLPGVQTVGEGSAGFNVRGSPTDQNIFYINSVPVYNTSHASGFFSAFNSDAIDEFSLHKSNIPIEYGGRISSIFNIKAKQGREDGVTANGGIGFITGRVLAEGPIQKGKSNFVVGLRSTYSDWAVNMMTNNDKVKNSKARFMDALTSFTFRLNPKNLINIFAYHSRDKMTLAATKNDLDYKNTGASLNWFHYFKQNSLNISLVHSHYNFYEESKISAFTSYSNSNKIQHNELKATLKFKLDKENAITIGANSILYNNNKGSYIPLSSENPQEQIDFGKEKGLEAAIFIGAEWKVSEKLSLYGGLRYNLFSSLGPQQINTYKEGLPKIEENIIETITYGDNEFIKTFKGLDFRFSGRYLLKDNLSLKLSYNRMHQFLYVLSNTISVSPNYKWKLIDPNSKPIRGDQYSIGLFSNIFDHKFEFSVESYYKKSENVVEIKDGADLFSTPYFEQITLQGDLKAYGIELMLKKPKGRLSGWINYTYSLSEIKVDDEFGENRINNGNKYKSNYDKPHNLNIVGSYIFSRRWRMSANFVYSTGRPITYPSSIYKFGEGIRLHYSERNAYRLPDYYRLDLSFTMEGNLKKQKIAHGSWTFSIYNVLGRKNAYSVYFNRENNALKGYKLSIFAAPIFSLTYNFKLGNYDN